MKIKGRQHLWCFLKSWLDSKNYLLIETISFDFETRMTVHFTLSRQHDCTLAIIVNFSRPGCPNLTVKTGIIFEHVEMKITDEK